MTTGNRFLALFHRSKPTDVPSPTDKAELAVNSALYDIDLRNGIASLKVTDPNYQKMEAVRKEIIHDVQSSNISKIEELFASFRFPETKGKAARDLMFSALNYDNTSLQMIEYLGSAGGVSSINFNKLANSGSLNNPTSIKKLKLLGSMMSQKEKDEAVQQTTELCLEYFVKGSHSLTKSCLPQIKLIIAAGANPDAKPYKDNLSARATADEAYMQDFAEINTAIMDGLKLQREWRAEALGSKPTANSVEAKLVA